MAAGSWWIDGIHQVLIQNKERRRGRETVHIRPSCRENYQLRKEAAELFFYQKGYCVDRQKEGEREEIAGSPKGWRRGQKMSVIELGKHLGSRVLAVVATSLDCLRAIVEALGW